MFVVNDDNSIYATRGDIVFFTVTAEDEGKNYKFQPGDVVRIKVYGKKDAEAVVLQKDFPVMEVTEKVEIFLSEEDTKIGEVISKPKDYWYEVELNPYDNPQTIIGYDEDGAKVFKLFPEGDDIPAFVPKPEDIPIVDEELDLASTRPVQNQAIARAFRNLEDGYERTHAAVAELHVTPQMYGAIGDGVADDTEALQTAINSGHFVQLNGIYRTTSWLVVSTDTYFFGDGVIYREAKNADEDGNEDYVFRVTDGATLTLRDITLKSDLLYMPYEYPRNANTTEAKTSNIFAVKVEQNAAAVVDNIKCKNVGGFAVWGKINVSNSCFDNCDMFLFAGSGSHDMRVDSCEISMLETEADISKYYHYIYNNGGTIYLNGNRVKIPSYYHSVYQGDSSTVFSNGEYIEGEYDMLVNFLSATMTAINSTYKTASAKSCIGRYESVNLRFTGCVFSGFNYMMVDSYGRLVFEECVLEGTAAFLPRDGKFYKCIITSPSFVFATVSKLLLCDCIIKCKYLGNGRAEDEEIKLMDCKVYCDTQDAVYVSTAPLVICGCSFYGVRGTPSWPDACVNNTFVTTTIEV